MTREQKIQEQKVMDVFYTARARGAFQSNIRCIYTNAGYEIGKFEDNGIIGIWKPITRPMSFKEALDYIMGI